MEVAQAEGTMHFFIRGPRKTLPGRQSQMCENRIHFIELSSSP